MISAEVDITPQFYDLDPMQIVWHGNYARYLEHARGALLDRIGYNYQEMIDSGCMWPIVDMRIKYVRSIRFNQTIRIRAVLAEYENRIRIDYRIHDKQTGALLTKAQTTQLAVAAASGELMFESPAVLLDKVRALL